MGTFKTFKCSLYRETLVLGVAVTSSINLQLHITTSEMLLPWKADVSNEMVGTEGLRREWRQRESSAILVVATHISIRNKSND
jgi:hypothetical protein